MADLSEIYKNKLKKKPELGNFTTGGGLRGGFVTGGGVPGKSTFTTGSMEQRGTGGQGNTGASQTGAAVQSGTGATPTTPGQNFPVDARTALTEQATEGGWGGADFDPNNTPVTRLGGKSNQAAMLNDQTAAFDPALNPRSQESTRVGGSGMGSSGEKVFNQSNTPQNKSPTNAYTAPDYEAQFNAIRDLRDYKNQKGAYAGEDRPVTIIGGYKSYADDLAAYSSGDVGSEGYNRIRNEKMQLKSMLGEATKGLVGSKAKAAAIESVLGSYSEQQKARISGEADVAQQGLSSQADIAAAQQKRASDLDKLGFDQSKFAAEFGLNQADLQRKMAADQNMAEDRDNRLALDTGKAAQDAAVNEARYGATGLERQKLLLDATNAGASQGLDQQKNLTERLKAAKDILGGATGDIDPEMRDMLLKQLGIL